MVNIKSWDEVSQCAVGMLDMMQAAAYGTAFEYDDSAIELSDFVRSAFSAAKHDESMWDSLAQSIKDYRVGCDEFEPNFRLMSVITCIVGMLDLWECKGTHDLWD